MKLAGALEVCARCWSLEKIIKKYGIGMYSIVVVWGAWDGKPNQVENS